MGVKRITLLLALMTLTSILLAQKPMDYVDPRIGTTNYGGVVVGPCAPFGIRKAGSRTFEYAYCDYAIASVAEGLGRDELAKGGKLVLSMGRNPHKWGKELLPNNHNTL